MICISILFDDSSCSTFSLDDLKNYWPPNKNVINIKLFNGDIKDIRKNNYSEYEGIQATSGHKYYFLGRKMRATLMGNAEKLLGVGYNINERELIILWYSSELTGVEKEIRPICDGGILLKENNAIRLDNCAKS